MAAATKLDSGKGSRSAEVDDRRARAARRRRMASIAPLRSAAARALIQELRTRFSLTNAESRLIDVALESSAPSYLSVRLGITVNTIKKQIRSVLSKMGASRLESLLIDLRKPLFRRDTRVEVPRPDATARSTAPLPPPVSGRARAS